MLPSSIHETLIVPAWTEDEEGRRIPADVWDLAAMVKEINREVVDPREFLSDSVYYYDAARGVLEKVA